MFKELLRRHRVPFLFLQSYPKYLFNRYINRIRINKPGIFIVGCGHSGTTVLLKIIGYHKNIFAIPYESNIALQENKSTVKKFIKRFDILSIANGKTRWVEKTPRHINHIGFLINHYPDGKIILIVRDGRDVAYSIKKRTGSLEDGINRWITDNSNAKPYLNHSKLLFIKYEDLVLNTDKTLKNIFAFIEEEYYPDLLNFHIEKKDFNFSETNTVADKTNDHQARRNNQIHNPIFDGRKKYLQMTKEEIEHVTNMQIQLLKEFGYY